MRRCSSLPNSTTAGSPSSGSSGAPCLTKFLQISNRRGCRNPRCGVAPRCRTRRPQGRRRPAAPVRLASRNFYRSATGAGAEFRDAALLLAAELDDRRVAVVRQLRCALPHEISTDQQPAQVQNSAMRRCSSLPNSTTAGSPSSGSSGAPCLTKFLQISNRRGCRNPRCGVARQYDIYAAERQQKEFVYGYLGTAISESK